MCDWKQRTKTRPNKMGELEIIKIIQDVDFISFLQQKQRKQRGALYSAITG